MRSNTPSSREIGFSRSLRAQPGLSPQQPRGISVAPGKAFQRQTYNPSSYDIIHQATNAPLATTRLDTPTSLLTKIGTHQREPPIGAYSRSSPNITPVAANLRPTANITSANVARNADLHRLRMEQKETLADKAYNDRNRLVTGVERDSSGRVSRDQPQHLLISSVLPRQPSSQVTHSDGIYYQGYQRADSDNEFQSGNKLSDVAANSDRALAGPQRRLYNVDQYDTTSTNPVTRVSAADNRSSASLASQAKQVALMAPPSMNRTKQLTSAVSPLENNYFGTYNPSRQSLNTTTSRAPISNTTPTSVSIKETLPQQKAALTASPAENAEAPIGFRNMGNTCYLNASMQALLATPGLIEKIENHFGVKELSSSSNQYSSTNMKSGVSKDMVDLARRPGPSIYLSALKKKCTERNDVFTGARQNDAHEFLRVLLLLLHENTNCIQGKPVYQEMKDYPHETIKDAADRWWQYHLSRDDSLVYDIFGGQQHSIIQCRVCGHQSWAFDPFLDLVLSFNKVQCPPVSLMLQGYTGLAHLTGADRYYCSRCKKPQDADRQVTIAKWPECLSLSLARFDRYGRKNSEEVVIEEVIITAPDCSADRKSRRYELYSIVVHTGTTDYGHYYAYVRKGGKWYRCDDSVVREVPFSIVKQEGNGVYVLFYQKIRQ